MASILFEHLLFFAVGFFQDFFITYYYQAIAKHRAAASAGLSFLVTIVNLLVLYRILTGIENQVLSIILAYALGGAAGTFFVVKRNSR